MLSRFKKQFTNTDAGSVAAVTLIVDQEKDNLLLAIKKAEQELHKYTEKKHSKDSQYQSLFGQIQALEKSIKLIKQDGARKHLEKKLATLQKELQTYSNVTAQNHEAEAKVLNEQITDVTQALAELGTEQEYDIPRQMLQGRLKELTLELQQLDTKHCDLIEKDLIEKVVAAKRKFIKYIANKKIVELSAAHLKFLDQILQDCAPEVADRQFLAAGENFLKQYFSKPQYELQLFLNEFFSDARTVIIAGKRKFNETTELQAANFIKEIAADASDPVIIEVVTQKMAEIVQQNMLEIERNRDMIFEQTKKNMYIKIAKQLITTTVADHKKSLIKVQEFFKSPMYEEDRRNHATFMYYKHQGEYFERVNNFYEGLLQLDLARFDEMQEPINTFDAALKTLYFSENESYKNHDNILQQCLNETVAGKKEILEVEQEICRVAIKLHELQVRHLIEQMSQQFAIKESDYSSNLGSKLLQFVPYKDELETVTKSFWELLKSYNVIIDSTELNVPTIVPATNNSLTDAITELLQYRMAYSNYSNALNAYINTGTAYLSDLPIHLSRTVLDSLEIYLAYAKLPDVINNNPQYKAALTLLDKLVLQLHTYHYETYEKDAEFETPYGPDLTLLYGIKNSIDKLKKPPVLQDLPELIDNLVQDALIRNEAEENCASFMNETAANESESAEEDQATESSANDTLPGTVVTPSEGLSLNMT